MRDRAFDVAELGLTFYLRSLDLEDPPFVALPVFLARQFRHSAIFVNTASGIEEPRDLAGKTVGEFATYGHDADVGEGHPVRRVRRDARPEPLDRRRLRPAYGAVRLHSAAASGERRRDAGAGGQGARADARDRPLDPI